MLKKGTKRCVNDKAVCYMREMDEFLNYHRLRWFGHMNTMDEERVPVNANIFEEVVEKDMLARALKYR